MGSGAGRGGKAKQLGMSRKSGKSEALQSWERGGTHVDEQETISQDL